MKNFDSKWERLAQAARRSPDLRDTSAPPGFATRIAAHAMSVEPRPLVSLFEQFSLRALGLACLLMFATLAASYPALANGEEEDELIVLDPVGEMLAMF